MLKATLKNKNIVLERGKRLQILCRLIINYIFLLILSARKTIKGIKKPIVHYYAVCWNEERMLPFMFQHYDQFVDHYTIYDNYSDDGSGPLINSHPRTTIKKFHTHGFNDEQHAKIKNQCWKQSRGKADYVIVCDIDEFLYHKDLSSFLRYAERNRYSFFRPEGWEMYYPKFPDFEEKCLLTDIVTKGVLSSNYGKSILFDPHRIVEINYEPGAHECHPLGIVKTYSQSDLKVLHYKHLGIDYILSRVYAYRLRQSPTNIEHGYAIHYNYEDSTITENFNNNLEKATPII